MAALTEAVFAIDARTGLVNLGTGGTALTPTSGSSSGADSNDPTYLAHTGTNYVYLPGGANVISVSDAAALDITGDIDIRACLAADDWTPTAAQAIVTKYGGAGSRSYYLRLNTAGTLSLLTSADGTAVNTFTSTVATGVADGATKWVRATLDVDNGVSGKTATFFLSDDGSTWTQLGTAVTTAGTTSIFNSTAGLQVGAVGTSTDPLAARVFRVQIFNGIGGTLVYDADLSQVNTGAALAAPLTGTVATDLNASYVSNLGTLGLAAPGRPGSGTGADTNDPIWLEHTGTNYLYLPGVTGNGATSPDSAALDITGDIDIKFRWSPSPGWTTFYTPLGKWGAAGQRSWRLNSGSGGVVLVTSADGTTEVSGTSTVAPNTVFSEGQTGWIRATLDVDDGAGNRVYKFYTSPDGTTWTQLGSTVTTAGTTSIFNSTSPVDVGTVTGITGNRMTGSVHRVIIQSAYDTANNTDNLAFDADFTTGITSGAQTSFTESSANAATVTINRSTSGRKSVAVVKPVWLFGTDDFMEFPDLPEFNFGASESATFFVAGRFWGTQGTNDVLIAKKANTTAATAGWSLTNGSTTALNGQAQIGDGTAGITATSASRTSGNLTTIAAVRNVASDNLTVYTNGTAGTPVTDTTSASLTNTEVVRIGRLAGAGTEYADMEFFGAAVFRRALSAAEITTLNDYYVNGGSVAAAEALLATAVLWVDASKSRAQAAIVRATSGRKAVAVTRPVWLFGTDDYLEVADSDLLDFGASDSFTVLACGRQWATASNSVWLSKMSLSLDTNPGYSIWIASGTTARFERGDGTSAYRRTGTLTLGALTTLAAVDTGSSWTGYVNGTATTSSANPGSAANALALRIGGSPSLVLYSDVELFAVAIWRRALSAGEIADMSTALTNAVLRPTVPDELALTLNTQAGDLLLASQPNDVVLHTTPKGLVLE